jgi:chromosome segregation ATPase
MNDDPGPSYESDHDDLDDEQLGDLIAMVRTLRARVAELEHAMDVHSETIVRLHTERNTARARVAELEKARDTWKRLAKRLWRWRENMVQQSRYLYEDGKDGE